MGFKTLNDSGTGTLWNKVKSYVNTRLKAFGSVATEDIVPINKGGTGAADVAGALANLGIGDYVVNVATVNSLSDSDLLFVNSGGSLKQVTKANSGMVTMDLLWENARPTSSFAGQTVSLNLSGYQYVGIMGALSATSLAKDIFITHIGESGMINFAYGAGAGGAASYYRTFNTSVSGIQFNDGYFAHTSADTDNNGAAIPCIIYGIKGVQ